MLDANETIDFTGELLNLIETLLREYERRKGPLSSDLERGLAVSFVLGVLRCNIDAIWDELAQAPHFAAQHPKVLFEDCTDKTPIIRPQDRERIRNLLSNYGWMGSDN